MNGYTSFALCYDRLMADVNYKERANHILSLFARYGKIPSLLLDVGCGTGNFAVEFAKKGLSVIGAEPSADMLSVAFAKDTQNILYLNQSAEELDLYGTVDGAVCLMDTINHITDKRVLSRALSRISLFMEKGSLFIFDVNTVYKHEHILGNNTFVLEDDDAYCVWQNEYTAKNKTVDIHLDFFINEDRHYIRQSEDIVERAYTKNELSEMLKKAGFKLLDVLGENSFSAPTKTAERHIYIAQKG